MSENQVWLRENTSTVKVLMYVEDEALRLKYASVLGAHNANALSAFPDAGFDLFVPEDHNFEVGTTSNKLNFKVKVAAWSEKPNAPNDVMPVTLLMMPRSSTGSKTPLRLANSVGVIDSGYRGNIMGVFDCLSTKDKSDGNYSIEKHSRVAQLMSRSDLPLQVKLVDSEEALGNTARGSGGFGSSGV